MEHYTLYTTETAPAATQPVLDGIQRGVGFLPNVFAVMGGSPSALNGFVEVTKRFGGSSLTATEREIVHIAASVENSCRYCVAGHTAFAKMQGVDDAIIHAVRTRGVIDDSKLAALHDFTRAMVVKRGHVDPVELDKFRSAGYSQDQVLEVILGICEKTFSNLTSILFDLPLDDAFKPYAWTPETDRNAA